MDSVDFIELCRYMAAVEPIIRVAVRDNKGEHTGVAFFVAEFLPDVLGKLKFLDVVFVVRKHLDNRDTVFGVHFFKNVAFEQVLDAIDLPFFVLSEFGQELILRVDSAEVGDCPSLLQVLKILYQVVVVG